MTASTRPNVPQRRVRTLADAARQFFRHGSPWALAMGSVVWLGLLVQQGNWAYGQLVILIVLLAAQPFVEWLIHVYVLHAKPFLLAGRSFDLYQARKHRAHHAEPRNLDILLVPLRGHVAGAVVLTAVCAVLPTWPLRLALLATAAVQTLVYEWVHFLIHTDYQPRSAAYRRLYAGHRLHHYRNENYWFGVSRRFGDTALGTDPAKDDVPVSATCLTLGR